MVDGYGGCGGERECFWVGCGYGVMCLWFCWWDLGFFGCSVYG